MNRFIHRYVRRVIKWCSTPSDEEVSERSAEHRLTRLSWDLGPGFQYPGDNLFSKMPVEQLDQVADDIKLMVARGNPVLSISQADMHLCTIRRIKLQRAGISPTPRAA